MALGHRRIWEGKSASSAPVTKGMAVHDEASEKKQFKGGKGKGV